MNRIISSVFTASALIFGVFLPREEAVAQTANNELVGTWTLVSIQIDQNGQKVDFYGPNPRGQMMSDPDGHLTVLIFRSDLPKFASNNRKTGTPEENQAVVQGSFAFFGTYSVDEAAKTVTHHIDACTFPNWDGAGRTFSYKISGDELDMTGAVSSTGQVSNYQTWKRVK
jgi:hypothetical protein